MDPVISALGPVRARLSRNDGLAIATLTVLDWAERRISRGRSGSSGWPGGA